jgi:Fe-S-cluster-containing dehydrogenase component
MKVLTAPRIERCSDCHSCSLACARFIHKSLSWDTAGIRIASSGGLSTGSRLESALHACRPRVRQHAPPALTLSEKAAEWW